MAEEPVEEVVAEVVEAAVETASVKAVEEVEAVMVEAVSEPVAEVTAAPAPVVKLPQVDLVDFKKVGFGSDAKGRLIVKSTEAAELKVQASKDKMTVVFDIENAEIADEFVRTLDASRLGTPVASVSSYLERSDPSQVQLKRR